MIYDLYELWLYDDLNEYRFIRQMDNLSYNRWLIWTIMYMIYAL